MNKTAIYSTIVVSVIASLAIFAVSSVEGAPPSKVACPAENVQHWYSTSFGVANTIEHATKPSITDTSIVEIPSSSDEVIGGAWSLNVPDRLNDLGYFVDDGGPRPVEQSDVTGAGLLVSGFTTICAEN